MAYVVMARIAMAYIVMAYIVMARIAMAYIVMAGPFVLGEELSTADLAVYMLTEMILGGTYQAI